MERPDRPQHGGGGGVTEEVLLTAGGGPMERTKPPLDPYNTVSVVNADCKLCKIIHLCAPPPNLDVWSSNRGSFSSSPSSAFALSFSHHADMSLHVLLEALGSHHLTLAEDISIFLVAGAPNNPPNHPGMLLPAPRPLCFPSPLLALLLFSPLASLPFSSPPSLLSLSAPTPPLSNNLPLFRAT